MVRRVRLSLVQSTTATSRLLPSSMSTASRMPSGEKRGLLQSNGVALSGVVLPDGSSHEIGEVLVDLRRPGKYARTPLSDTVNCAPLFNALLSTFSTIGTDSPVTS